MKTISVGSDFSGVGAFNQALIRLGIDYEEVFACDMDKFARETFIHNYGEPKDYPKDVYDRELPKESLDIYVSSPPCQSFSLAGKRLGKEDKRGVLFFNSHEFIKTNKPRYFIFENVKGLLSDDNGKTFSEWVNMLGGKSVNGLPVLFPYEDSVPYHIYYKVMNAKKHGVPQNRERVFIIGIRDDQDNTFRWAKEEHLTKRLKDVLENEVDEKYFLSKENVDNLLVYNERQDKNGTGFSAKFRDVDKTKTMDALKCGGGGTYDLITINYNGEIIKNKPEIGQANRIYDKNGLAPALNCGWKPLTKQNKIRRLTPRECFRLMDFPDSFTWTCSDTQAYKQAGNSIVVRCLELIIKQFNLNAEM